MGETSEKTLELNVCSQIHHRLKQCGFDVVWTGLKQKEEAEKGFDSATSVGGCFFAFQFKRPEYKRPKYGTFGFKAPHDQMQTLINFYKKEVQGEGKRGRVFYALPCVGEIDGKTDLLTRTWLLDVANIQGVSVPPKRKKSNPKAPFHKICISGQGQATICSNPVTCGVRTVEDFLCFPNERDYMEIPHRWLKPEHPDNEGKYSGEGEDDLAVNKNSDCMPFDVHAFGALVVPRTT